MVNNRFFILDRYFCFVLFFFLWLLYGGNLWNGDREAYEVYFQRDALSYWGVEVGYGALNLIFNKLGASFQMFQVFISFITLFLTFRFISKVTCIFSTSLLVYFFFMFPLDYVLMRNTLAFSIVLNALVPLFNNDKKSFFWLVVLATLFHQSACLFMILIFTDGKNDVKKYKVIFFMVLFAVFIKVLLLSGFMPLRIVEHLNYYGVSVKSLIFNILMQFISVFIFLRGFNREKKIFLGNYWPRFICNINIVSLILIPLYFYGDIFLRVFRLFVFIDLLMIVHFIMAKRILNLWMLLYLVLFSSYLFYYFIYLQVDLTLVPLFRDNFFSFVL
ncbi:EpsG family protein [Vibrio sp. S17_S38]|uniref:EpsG family protein n=1 Tax=Vibrio sp. S17_S38 TaxID=2720229 RepID=UPI0016813A61|nr:EpsG family protein [Vibrio sp. S17_S38]MBD1573266.1 EpsG family protein [Vibrio sp. S17_S38]